MCTLCAKLTAVWPFVQPFATLNAITDKFKTVNGLTAGLPYYATVRMIHGFPLLDCRHSRVVGDVCHAALLYACCLPLFEGLPHCGLSILPMPLQVAGRNADATPGTFSTPTGKLVPTKATDTLTISQNQ